MVGFYDWNFIWHTFSFCVLGYFEYPLLFRCDRLKTTYPKAFRGCRNCTQSSDGAIDERTRQAPTDVCREPAAHRIPNAQVQGLMSAHKYETANAPDLRE